MTFLPVRENEVFGLVHPAIDAHTLGISSVATLLNDCRIHTIVADRTICEAVGHLSHPDNITLLQSWIRRHQITRLGFSYRLDPEQGTNAFNLLFTRMHEAGMLAHQGGPLKGLYFAGLPEACRRISQQHGNRVGVFSGDETPDDTLGKLGIPARLRSSELSDELEYDQMRFSFASKWIAKGHYLGEKPVDCSGYEGFGTGQDRLTARLQYSAKRRLLPLTRAHLGPYLPNRSEAVRLFLDWCRELAGGGFLDVLSIGPSQLSQSHFGEVWGDQPDGGGVPINSAQEYRIAWEMSRPMLVRTYAGTTRVPQLARLYDQTINTAWHAFPFWWFCQTDGRGPHTLGENLSQHLEALNFVAATGKPFEPNVPHHFAFRGADDITYVVSAVLAARTAKLRGIRYLILQNMLNTPRYTWGIQDLAKARAMLSLVRELQDSRFTVFFQPRAGLDSFSPDLERARVQLAAISALMDDIEPHDWSSPQIVHVVSFCEGSHLASPPIIEESIKITRSTITEYRRLKAAGQIPLMDDHPEVLQRQEEILSGARTILQAIEESIASPYTVAGLYRAFVAGFLPVPFLWGSRQQFQHAVNWTTKIIQGAVKVVDTRGQPIPPRERAELTAELLRSEKIPALPPL